jgi:dolichol-phosphate mannosyltransferase
MSADAFLLSIVVAAYNEEQSLRLLIPALRGALDTQPFTYEVILVDDGSSDQTGAVAKEFAAADGRVRYLKFSRNFGQQAAITAGLDAARGDAAVVMDADLQDPPELLPEMVRLHLQGYEVVSAQRSRRDGESATKLLTARIFYGLMRRFVDERMKPEVGDFRLYGPRALAALRGMREQHRFLRGMAAWAGFKEVILPFARPARVAGETKFGMWKMLRFAWTGISSFSALPLRASLLLGIATAAAGFLYLAYTVYAALVLHATVQGWASLIAVQVIFSGVTLVALGLLGEYVARIYEESKRRPLYLVEEAVNFEEQAAPKPTDYSAASARFRP